MNDKREALAEYAHEAWSGWMHYMFEKGSFWRSHDEEGNELRVYVMPQWAVERWMRQANTSYADLPESEKDSDRQEADRMLAIIEAHELPLWYRMGYDEESVAQGDTE